MKNDDKYIEQLLGVALDDSVESSPPELKTEEELAAEGLEPHEFSKGFEQRMNRVRRKERRKEWISAYKKTMKHIAAGFAVFIGIGGILIGSVDAIRVPVLSFILNIGKESSQILTHDDLNVPISDFMSKYLPTYSPDGFVVTSFSEFENGYSIAYQREDGSSYQIEFNMNTDTFYFNSEDSVLSEIEVDGSPAVVSSHEDYIIVSWPTNGHMYCITGTITQEECVKILESVDI